MIISCEFCEIVIYIFWEINAADIGALQLFLFQDRN